jgi:hypothetical protein
MGRLRVNCRLCTRHIDVCGPLSRHGKCADCAIARMRAAIVAMTNKTGEEYRKWANANGAAGRPRSGDGGSG